MIEYDIRKLQNEYVMKTYLPDLLLTKGKGMKLWDSKGNEYLDFTSGIGVCNLGHCHPDINIAISKQIGKLIHTSNLFINEQQPQLAEKLVTRAFGKGVAFFANSGAEANEGMIKLARKYGFDKGKNEIIVMDESFHGRTLATLAATGRRKYRHGFSPDMPGFLHVPFNNIDVLKRAISDKTTAILLEPIQGEGGVVPASQKFLEEVRIICDEKDILLLFDEVQCGIGRTGFFYGHQAYDVVPDALSLAKGLGNGFPIGAFLVKDKFKNVLSAGSHASTFGGTPLACATANAVVNIIEDKKILENTCKQSKYLFESLNKLKEKHDCICEVRGKGLMVGIVLDRPLGNLLIKLRDDGLLALPAGENILRLLPPLIVSEIDINQALSVIDKALTNYME